MGISVNQIIETFHYEEAKVISVSNENDMKIKHDEGQNIIVYEKCNSFNNEFVQENIYQSISSDKTVKLNYEVNTQKYSSLGKN